MLSLPCKGTPLLRRHLSPSIRKTAGSIPSKLWKPVHCSSNSDCEQIQSLVTVTLYSGFPWICTPVPSCVTLISDSVHAAWQRPENQNQRILDYKSWNSRYLSYIELLIIVKFMPYNMYNYDGSVHTDSNSKGEEENDSKAELLSSHCFSLMSSLLSCERVLTYFYKRLHGKMWS